MPSPQPLALSFSFSPITGELAGSCLVNRGNAFTAYLASKRPTPRDGFIYLIYEQYTFASSHLDSGTRLVSLFLRLLQLFFLSASHSLLCRKNFKREKSMISDSTLPLSTRRCTGRRSATRAIIFPVSRFRAFLFTRAANFIAVLRNYGASVAL